MRKLISLLFITLFFTTASKAQEADSLRHHTWSQERPTWVDRTPLETAVGVMIPIVAFDLVHLKQDHAVRSIRQQYIPSYHNRLDDFVTPVPLLAVWGMRLAGIEGRSNSHLEALSAQGLSVGLSTGIAFAGKELIKRHRPQDNSDDYAFPSAHTATAFTFATILDAEYGAEYPWISAIGYTLASGVGIARVANDRHWATDVVTGAGVGVFSAYVGYLINDLIWGRGLERFELDYYREDWQSPYFLTVQKGFNSLLSKTFGYEASGLGNTIGIMARVPLYKRLGVRLSGDIHTSNNDLQPREYLHGYSVMVGADFMQGFWGGRLWLDGNLSIGYLSEIRLSEGLKSRSNSIPFVSPGAVGRVGIGATLLTANHFAVQLSSGYNYAPVSRSYSRTNKRGLSGIDFGLGMTYVIH